MDAMVILYKTITGIYNQMTARSKGVALSALGVLALTPDSLLVRKVAHVPDQTVLFYRNLSFALFMLISLLMTEKWNSWNKIKALGKWGILSGVVFGSSLWLMAAAIQNTAAANVLVIQASNPVFAAMFSWLIMKESMTRLTLGTSAVCIIAIILIFAGDVGSSSSEGKNNTLGLLFAVASSSTFGFYVVMLRWLSIYQT